MLFPRKKQAYFSGKGKDAQYRKKPDGFAASGQRIRPVFCAAATRGREAADKEKRLSEKSESLMFFGCLCQMARVTLPERKQRVQA